MVKLIVGERLDRPEVMGDWRRLRQRHRLIYELDDDVWTVHPTNAMAYRTYGVHSVQDAVATCCAVANLVTVSTEPLAEQVRRQSGQDCVRVIKNCIPEFVLGLERPRREHVTMGWKSGGGGHSLDVALVATAVRRAMDRTPDLRLHIVGTDFRDTLGHLHAYHTKWEPDHRKFFTKIDFDFGLAPIVPSAFNACKSYLKALEYAALGILAISHRISARTRSSWSMG